MAQSAKGPVADSEVGLRLAAGRRQCTPVSAWQSFVPGELGLLRRGLCGVVGGAGATDAWALPPHGHR